MHTQTYMNIFKQQNQKTALKKHILQLSKFRKTLLSKNVINYKQRKHWPSWDMRPVPLWCFLVPEYPAKFSGGTEDVLAFEDDSVNLSCQTKLSNLYRFSNELTLWQTILYDFVVGWKKKSISLAESYNNSLRYLWQRFTLWMEETHVEITNMHPEMHILENKLFQIQKKKMTWSGVSSLYGSRKSDRTMIRITWFFLLGKLLNFEDVFVLNQLTNLTFYAPSSLEFD